MNKKINSAFFIFICALCLTCTTACTKNRQYVQLANPWHDCQTDLNYAAKVAGFKFPLVLSNFNVRAMKDMIQIEYPIDKERTVTVRKSGSNKGDISGDYNIYPVNKPVTLKNGVKIDTRGDNKLIYVANFGAEQGYYSISCDKGLSVDEIYGIYKIIAAAEAPKVP